MGTFPAPTIYHSTGGDGKNEARKNYTGARPLPRQLPPLPPERRTGWSRESSSWSCSWHTSHYVLNAASIPTAPSRQRSVEHSAGYRKIPRRPTRPRSSWPRRKASSSSSGAGHGRGHRENTAAPSTVASPVTDRAQGPRTPDSDFLFKHHHVHGAPQRRRPGLQPDPARRRQLEYLSPLE